MFFKGAIAGALAVWLMDRFTWAFYLHEDKEAFLKEKKAQKGGRYAPNAAGKHLTELFCIVLPAKEQYIVGRSIHYIMGIVPGALYALVRDRAEPFGFWRGPLYGFSLFISFDEIMTPALGYSSGPLAYPWQAHARDFISHLILGTTTDTVIELLSDKK